MNDNLSFRLADPSDQSALVDLQRRASLMWEEYRDALLENPDAIELPMGQITDRRTIVAERCGRTVGFAVVLPRDDRNAELDGLFVEPEAWNGGIGRGLIEQVQALASSDGAKAIYVVANPRAKGFYTACGFVLIGEALTRFGTGLVMRREISSGLISHVPSIMDHFRVSSAGG